MMAEFAAGLDDSWALQAIVGGGGGGDVSNSCYGVMDLSNKDDFLLGFPDMFFETRSPPLTTTDEFGGVFNQPLMMFPVLGGSPSNSSSSAEVHEEKKSVEQKQICPDLVQSGAAVTSYVPKYKLRRKNQQKRVVLQITAEDLSSDMWAWRKYGQKPIKGSPYPRSYYRCSSTKGCIARRQVEQSCTDASIYIVTYSGEHNHSQPTRKNALAGTIRHKFPNLKSPSAPPPPSGSSSSPASSSNTSTGAVDVQLSPTIPRNIKEEMMIMEEKVDNNNNNNNNVIFSGINLDDDFFSGLEDIDDLISELSNGRHCFTKEQFPGHS